MNYFKNMTIQEFAQKAKGSKNKHIEELLKKQKAKGEPFTVQDINDHKSQSLLRSSEGTLSVMLTKLTIKSIIGLDVIKTTILGFAELLRNGDPRSPRALLFAGPFGVGKSTFAPILGALCGYTVVKLELIKDKFVGESERKLKLALSLLEILSPVILFIDEISEMIPSRRNESGDGGVSQNILGELFQFFARDELRGKVLLVAATNVPERLDPAWIDRFIVLPFLELQPKELCHLIGLYEKQILNKTTINPDSLKILEACSNMYQKGVSPRKLRDIFNFAVNLSQEFNEDVIIEASNQYTGEVNPYAVAYASLNALALTSFKKYLPWSSSPGTYTYPWYVTGIVDEKTGELNREKLAKRINEYRQYVHF